MTIPAKKITEIAALHPYSGKPVRLCVSQTFSQCCGSMYTFKQINTNGIALIPFIFGKERQAGKGRVINTLKHIKSKNGDFTIMVREAW